MSAATAEHNMNGGPQCSPSISSTLANNAKDKSPMCLINELSRFNNIKHEYHLIDECGPPHDKTFTVVLKLGDSEEYRSSGASIKKAQRSAASVALKQTKLTHPSPRLSKSCESKSMWPLTPTVELNVLAMKLGETPEYHVYEPPRPQPTPTPFHFGAIGATAAVSAYDFRGMHYQRYHIPRGPYCATLTIGSRQFVGKGRTSQSARHAAAEEALKVLRDLPLPESVNGGNNSAAVSGIKPEENFIKSPISLVHEMALKRNLSVKFEVIGESGPSHMPKFVTQCTVGEIVTSGEGNGKKISKRNSAIRMLEELNKLEPLPTISAEDSNDPNNQNNVNASLVNNQRIRMVRRKPFIKKKRSNNIIKDASNNNRQHQSFDDESGESNMINNKINSHKQEEQTPSDADSTQLNSSPTIHPINRLIQLQQARKEKEPQFTVISERCTERRRREFTIECTITLVKTSNAPNIVSAIGVGPNKKIAKKNAAESMLQQLGYSSKPHPQSILKQDSGEAPQPNPPQPNAQQPPPHHLQRKIRQVKFVEENKICQSQQLVDVLSNAVQSQPTKVGRQLVPGLILMPSEVNVSFKTSNNQE